MGVFSKYHRYRDAGESANVNNVERFGEPAYSFFTSSKIFSLHHHIDITDANEQVVYQSRTKVFTIHDKTEILDRTGNVVANVSKKIFTLHERHFITMSDGTKFQLSNELWHIVKDITNIEGLGWQLRGNIAALNFELYDQNGNVVAVIGQKMFSIHDKYCIDIYQPQYEQIIVTILITLQHMVIDRERRAHSISSSSSHNN